MAASYQSEYAVRYLTTHCLRVVSSSSSSSLQGHKSSSNPEREEDGKGVIESHSWKISRKERKILYFPFLICDQSDGASSLAINSRLLVFLQAHLVGSYCACCGKNISKKKECGMVSVHKLGMTFFQVYLLSLINERFFRKLVVEEKVQSFLWDFSNLRICRKVAWRRNDLNYLNYLFVKKNNVACPN